MRAALKTWLPFAVLATVLAGMVYVAAHQVLRQSANDPQIQLAEDWADTIVSGNDPSRLNLGAYIDPAHSLAPFGIVYGKDGNILASSVAAPSTMKQPDGVFDSLEAHADKEVRFTWQPASGERYATVIKKATFQDKIYYVLAARNLREVEARAGQLTLLTALGWVTALVAVAVAQHVHLVAHAVRRLRAARQ
jgi:hypothetical protein